MPTPGATFTSAAHTSAAAHPRPPRRAVPRDALTGEPFSALTRYWMRVHGELNPQRRTGMSRMTRGQQLAAGAAVMPLTLHRHVTEDSAPDPWAAAEYAARPQRRANAPQGCTFSRPFARYLRDVLPESVAIADLASHEWWKNTYVADRVRLHLHHARYGDLAYEAVLLHLRDGLDFDAVADVLCERPGVRVGDSWVQTMCGRARHLVDEFRYTGRRYHYRHVASTMRVETNALESSFE